MIPIFWALTGIPVALFGGSEWFAAATLLRPTGVFASWRLGSTPSSKAAPPLHFVIVHNVTQIEARDQGRSISFDEERFYFSDPLYICLKICTTCHRPVDLT
jgi:hypothetical protein